MIRLPKIVEFPESKREEYAFSDSDEIRLDPADNSFKLKAGTSGFPTSGGGAIWVLTQEINPTALRGLVSFQSFHEHGLIDGDSVTVVQYTIHDVDGAIDYYWNSTAGAWQSSNLSGPQWTTEEEMATNIGQLFSDAGGIFTKMRLRVRLATTDSARTPRFWKYHLAYDAQISSLREEYYRALGVGIINAVRGEFDIHWSSDGNASFDLDTAVIPDVDTPFDITDIVAVYDETNDPGRLVNLLSSYDSVTKVVTLTSAIANGDTAFITAQFKPTVTISAGSQDFVELETIPSIALHNFTDEREREIPFFHRTAVVDRAAGTMHLWDAARQVDTSFVCTLVCPSTTTQLSLEEELKLFFKDNKILKVPGIDEDVQLLLRGPHRMTTVPNQKGIHSASVNAVLKEMVLLSRTVSTSAGEGVYPVLRVTETQTGATTPDPVI